MFVLILLSLVSYVGGQCTEPRGPDPNVPPELTLGHLYPQYLTDLPLSYDGRIDNVDCARFYTTNGNSSKACGDCWIQSLATHLGAYLCKKEIGPIPDGQVLGVYHTLTCYDFPLKSPTCKGGDLWKIYYAARSGLATGTNAPEDPINGCKKYKLKPCVLPVKKEDRKDCPNWKDPDARIHFVKNDCAKKCDDGSEIKLFGKGTVMQKLSNPPRVPDMQRLIEEYGSLITGYWIGDHFKDVGRGPRRGEVLMDRESDYKDGILNHYMNLVGFDTTTTIDKEGNEVNVNYWLAKNAFGDDFADRGVIKILAGSNLNGIEEEVILFKNIVPKCETLLPFTMRYTVAIDGVKAQCYSESGKKCMNGCKEFAYKTDTVDFTCDRMGETYGMAMSMNITSQCVEVK